MSWFFFTQMLDCVTCFIGHDESPQGEPDFLQQLTDFSGRTVGLCREVVLLDRAPAEAHDRRVEVVLTEPGSLSVR